MMDDLQFRQLLERLELCWKGYIRVRRGVKKRIHRHMRESGIGTLASYLEKIEVNGEFRKEVERRATVPISCFFRDRDLWEAIVEDVMPALKIASPDRVRVWSAGCAMGQEVYTLRIIWMAQEKKHLSLPSLEIWATDLDAGILEKAKEGIYPAGSMKGIPEDIKKSFFVPLPAGRWMIREEVKKGVFWERHDFNRDSAVENFDMLFLRNNLLTYYRKSVGVSTFARVTGSLNDGGYLVVGKNEKIPSGHGILSSVGSCGCLYRKKVSGK